MTLFKRRYTTPTIIQMESTECGAACLGMILGYYKRFVPLEKLRIQCGVSRDGSNALNIVKAAQHYNLDAKGFKADIDDLKKIEGPSILFWKFNHFIVLEGFSKNCVYINDPSLGRRWITYKDLDDNFTGIVLTFDITPQFKKGGYKSNLIQALKSRLVGTNQALAFIFLAGLSLVAPSLALPALVRIFIDDVMPSPQLAWQIGFSIAIIVTIVIAGLMSYLQQLYLNRLQQKLSMRLSSKFLWHILRLPLSFYAQRFSAEIVQRMQLNTIVSQSLTGSLATTAIDICLVIIYALVMFSYDSLIATVSIITALLNLSVLTIINLSNRDGYTKMTLDSSKSHAMSIVAMQHIETIKSTGSEDDFFSKWSGYQAKAIMSEQSLGVKETLFALPNLLQALTITLVLSLGSWRVMEGKLTPGMLMALLLLSSSFLMPILRFINLGSTLQMLKSYINRLDDVLKHPQDTIYEDSFSENSTNENRQIIQLAGYLEFKNVSFGYSPLDPPLIHDLNFSLKPGQRLALVGPSGCGKSTISKLAAQLYKPWDGYVLYDGKKGLSVMRDLFTRSVATVDQDIFLFDGTIKENITLWDQTASEEDLMDACKDACIHEEILMRDLGYDSVIKEGGKNFSGGQKQRLEIARALLNKPTILILDEATSALDSQTELKIVDNIRKRGCTCIIVAHRLSTIKDCDEILVINNGKIIQRGTHEELKNISGIYQELIIKEIGPDNG
ncbi:MAG: NHLP family bacteriocin export ABC transporter peptidase/permease/ATPase subunit [Parachlamydiales bacterium]|nr:NHLP family bacteriocin export ABC transporter peptidase/permease/ATPase subunit [Parachlamydiales bacterium]